MENKHDCKQTFIPQLEFRRFNWKKGEEQFFSENTKYGIQIMAKQERDELIY